MARETETFKHLIKENEAQRKVVMDLKSAKEQLEADIPTIKLMYADKISLPRRIIADELKVQENIYNKSLERQINEATVADGMYISLSRESTFSIKDIMDMEEKFVLGIKEIKEALDTLLKDPEYNEGTVKANLPYILLLNKLKEEEAKHEAFLVRRYYL